MATKTAKTNYLIVPKETGEAGKYAVSKPGQEKPYIVSLGPVANGVRCSCPSGIHHARKYGTACKHEDMVRRMVAEGAVAATTSAAPKQMKPTAQPAEAVPAALPAVKAA